MDHEQENRLQRTIARFDAVNAEDPRRIDDHGEARPGELVDAERLSAWVARLEPEPSVALRLAARCQHLGRFRVPRSDFPLDAAGYHAWRRHLAQLHAELAGNILREEGWDDATIEQVKRINLKAGLKRDEAVQTMEDALCLAFLEHEAEAFAGRHAPAKVIEILRKSWAKMSERGRAVALQLDLPPAVAELVAAALR